jgi:hypothetical protein
MLKLPDDPHGSVNAVPMTPADFQKFFPLVDDWMWAALAAHAGTARPVASCRFPRLPLYFTAETLASAKVVITDRSPLSAWGLTQFATFERREPDGITYLDTCFLKPHQSKNEAIHFHELIHVIQWRVLGAERFLRSYADGLERFGYRDSPLEVMAYDAEARFVASTAGFDAEELVAENLARIT